MGPQLTPTSIINSPVAGGTLNSLLPNPSDCPHLACLLVDSASSSQETKAYIVDFTAPSSPPRPISADLDGATVTAACWSVKGKQLALGLSDGRIVQVTPDGSSIKADLCRPVTDDLPEGSYLSDLFWIENHVFIVAYNTPSTAEGDDEDPPHDDVFLVLTRTTSGELTHHLLSDPSPAFGLTGLKSHRYIAPLKAWSPFQNAIFVASAPSTDVGLIGRLELSDDWEVLELEETSRPTLPFSSLDKNADTAPLGMALDVTLPKDAGDDEAVKPADLRAVARGEDENTKMPFVPPRLWVLDSDGSLGAWWILNLDQSGEKGYPAMTRITEAQDATPVEAKAPESTGSTAPTPSGFGGFGQSAASGAAATPSTNKPASTFGASATSSPFGKPAAPSFGGFGTPSAFGQAAGTSTQNSPFASQPSTSGSAFGSPSAFGSTSKPAGSALGSPSTFGQASRPASSGFAGFGQPSAFGSASNAAATPSTPSAGATGAFGSSSGFGQSSAFGSKPATGFGQSSGFGQPATPTSTSASTSASPFGAFGGSSNSGGFASFKKTETPDSGSKSNAFGNASQSGGGGFGVFKSTPSAFGAQSDTNSGSIIAASGSNSSPFGSTAPKSVFGQPVKAAPLPQLNAKELKAQEDEEKAASTGGSFGFGGLGSMFGQDSKPKTEQADGAGSTPTTTSVFGFGSSSSGSPAQSPFASTNKTEAKPSPFSFAAENDGTQSTSAFGTASKPAFSFAQPTQASTTSSANQSTPGMPKDQPQAEAKQPSASPFGAFGSTATQGFAGFGGRQSSGSASGSKPLSFAPASSQAETPIAAKDESSSDGKADGTETKTQQAADVSASQSAPSNVQKVAKSEDQSKESTSSAAIADASTAAPQQAPGPFSFASSSSKSSGGFSAFGQQSTTKPSEAPKFSFESAKESTSPSSTSSQGEQKPSTFAPPTSQDKAQPAFGSGHQAAPSPTTATQPPPATFGSSNGLQNKEELAKEEAKPASGAAKPAFSSNAFNNNNAAGNMATQRLPSSTTPGRSSPLAGKPVSSNDFPTEASGEKETKKPFSFAQQGSSSNLFGAKPATPSSFGTPPSQAAPKSGGFSFSNASSQSSSGAASSPPTPSAVPTSSPLPPPVTAAPSIAGPPSSPAPAGQNSQPPQLGNSISASRGSEVSESGLQGEFLKVYLVMEQELKLLENNIHQCADFQAQVRRSTVGSALQDLERPVSWSFGDLDKLSKFEKDLHKQIASLEQVTKGHRQRVQELEGGLLKAEVKREEAARFLRANTDPEFAKLIRARQLGPEHAQNQAQLRSLLTTVESRLKDVESFVLDLRTRIRDQQAGRKPGGLKAPSLDSIQRTMRNISLTATTKSLELDDLLLELELLQRSETGARSVSRSFREGSVASIRASTPGRQASPFGELDRSFRSTHITAPILHDISGLGDALPSVNSTPTKSKAARQADAIEAVIVKQRSSKHLAAMLISARKEPILNQSAEKSLKGVAAGPNEQQTFRTSDLEMTFAKGPINVPSRRAKPPPPPAEDGKAKAPVSLHPGASEVKPTTSTHAALQLQTSTIPAMSSSSSPVPPASPLGFKLPSNLSLPTGPVPSFGALPEAGIFKPGGLASSSPTSGSSSAGRREGSKRTHHSIAVPLPALQSPSTGGSGSLGSESSSLPAKAPSDFFAAPPSESPSLPAASNVAETTAFAPDFFGNSKQQSSKPKEEASTPATKPNFSFGPPAATQSSFGFGSRGDEKATFGTQSSSPAKPTFSFDKAPAAKSGFSFGPASQSEAMSTTTPQKAPPASFSFGASKATPQPDLPKTSPFGFASTPSTTPQKPPAFSFAASSEASKKGTGSFGLSGQSGFGSTSPFGSGSSSKAAPSKSVFSVPSSSSSSDADVPGNPTAAVEAATPSEDASDAEQSADGETAELSDSASPGPGEGRDSLLARMGLAPAQTGDQQDPEDEEEEVETESDDASDRPEPAQDQEEEASEEEAQQDAEWEDEESGSEVVEGLSAVDEEQEEEEELEEEDADQVDDEADAQEETVSVGDESEEQEQGTAGSSDVGEETESSRDDGDDDDDGEEEGEEDSETDS